MSSKRKIFDLDRLKSGHRKLVYLGGIVVLMVGSILLGAPSTDENSGGKLPKMRVEYKLGESTLGQVDPTSATMNLVLLGLRGIAANVLWLEHDEFFKTKNWARMEATAQSIITLQPHFLEVWRFHGWYLAFNVSSQWDDVRDRFYWVKKGAKFTMQGANKNEAFAELPWEVGGMLGRKIGRSDEWRFFRKYFVKDPDPDPRWNGKPADPDFNRDVNGAYLGEDNYLAAHNWYVEANRREALRYEEFNKGQHKGQKQMMRELFRHYPARCYFDLADALHREGTFGDTSKNAWDRAYEEWANGYGKERFYIDTERRKGIYWLDPAQGDIDQMIKEDEDTKGENDPPIDIQMARMIKEDWIDRRQNVTNYRYWKARGKIEADPTMVAAHREMYEGRELWKSGRFDWGADGTPPDAVKKLESGLTKFQEMFAQVEAQKTTIKDDLTQDDTLIDEALLAIKYYREAHRINEVDLPENYPMKKVWDAHQDRIPEIEREFERDLRGRNQ